MPLIDLTVLTQREWERMGPEGTTGVFLYLYPGEFSTYPKGVSDNTLLQGYGASIVAGMVNEWLEVTGHPLRAYFDDDYLYY